MGELERTELEKPDAMFVEAAVEEQIRDQDQDEEAERPTRQADGEDEWVDLDDEPAGPLDREATSNPAANKRAMFLPPQALEERPEPAATATRLQSLSKKETQNTEREQEARKRKAARLKE